MRTTQEIINVVTDHEFYYPDNGMCEGLNLALRNLCITQAEYTEAEAAITDYLFPFVFLKDKLCALGLPCADADLVEFYRNWEARPAWLVLDPCTTTKVSKFRYEQPSTYAEYCSKIGASPDPAIPTNKPGVMIVVTGLFPYTCWNPDDLLSTLHQVPSP